MSTYDIKGHKQKGGEWETGHAYYWRDFNGSGKGKPDDPLTKERKINESKGPAESPAHLIPEEADQTKRATILTTQFKQANKHDKK